MGPGGPSSVVASSVESSLRLGCRGVAGGIEGAVEVSRNGHPGMVVGKGLALEPLAQC